MLLRSLQRLVLPLALVVLVVPVAKTQGSRADYERAAALGRSTYGLVANERLDVTWLDGGRALWYTRDGEAGAKESVLVDAATGERRLLPSVEAISAAIAAVAEPGATTGPVMVGFDGEAFYLTFAEGTQAWRYDLATDEVTGVGIGAAEPLLLPPSASAPRSNDGGARCPIRFVNTLDVPVTILWVPRYGDEREYGTVEPGGTWSTSTFAGHAWVARSADGALRAGFVAESGRPVALVAWGAGGEARSERRGRPGTAVGQGASNDASSVASRPGAFVRDHDVWVRDADTGEEVRLTTGGTAAAGFGGRPRASSDGRYAVALHTTAGDSRQVHYVESSPRDQLQPKLHSYSYLKPGDAIDHDRPRLFDLVERREVSLDDALFPNPWSISRLAWQTDSQTFTFLYNQRGHQVLRLVAVDATTGEARALIDETSETFIDYSGKTFLDTFSQSTDEGARTDYLWASERDGWNHLYEIDGQTGAVLRQLTQGEWVVRAVEDIDASSPGPAGEGDERVPGRVALLSVSGIFPDQDPYHIHFARLGLDTGELVNLTFGDGTHELDWSPDGGHYVDTYSRVDLPPVHELRRASDGGLVTVLETADWSALLATGWRHPERFVAKGRDGETDIWGILRRPTNFDPTRSYPVIEQIYAGPHGAFVPKDFRVSSGPAEVAELGFLVVQLDGMGTNHRGKAFHDVAWQNLGDSGFPDRRLWIEAAAEHEPAMDLSRVGIYGGSAGGQSALRALLAHGDFYHAAVADCGCHDNRVDKIWWNEAWMGWPIGPHYEEQSNVTNAHELTGDLLLIVGEADENVDPASTMQVVDALIRADKDFDLLVMPGVGHGAAGTAYGTRRLRDFFVRKLLGVEPRWE